MGLGCRTVENLSSLNYGLAFGMTFEMLLKGGNTANCEYKSTRHRLQEHILTSDNKTVQPTLKTTANTSCKHEEYTH